MLSSPAPTLRINGYGLTSFIAADEFNVARGMIGLSRNWEATTDPSPVHTDRAEGGLRHLGAFLDCHQSMGDSLCPSSLLTLFRPSVWPVAYWSPGRMWGQGDSIPGSGEMQTTSWLRGEVITDR